MPPSQIRWNGGCMAMSHTLKYPEICAQKRFYLDFYEISTNQHQGVHLTYEISLGYLIAFQWAPAGRVEINDDQLF